jgi:flagellar protein FliJ
MEPYGSQSQQEDRHSCLSRDAGNWDNAQRQTGMSVLLLSLQKSRQLTDTPPQTPIMGDFTFRLETVLRARQQQRDACRADLAIAIEEDAVLARRLAELDQSRGEAVRQRREAAAPGPLDLDRLAELRRYEESLSREKQEVEEQQREAAWQVEQRRDALLAADREARALEKLEARQREQHDARQERRETMILDEIAAMRREGSTEYGTI